MSNFQSRIVRAAKLDVSLYEEVEADTGAMGQAVAVVVLSSIAGGIGSISLTNISWIFFGIISALVGWFIWAYLTYIIGTKLLPEPQTQADHKELLRTIGFSSAPGLLRILGIIPFLRSIIFFATGIWMLIAMIIAVRQALDYKSTLRAICVCIIGWIIQGIVFWIFLSRFAGTGNSA